MKLWSVAILLLPMLTVPAFAAGDLAAGAVLFNKCRFCHSAGEGLKIGPVLNGVVGRVAGSLEGFNYSNALKAAGAAGLVWTPEMLDKWLKGPTALVPGTKMSLALTAQADVDNIIAYLISVSPNYMPADGVAPAVSSSSAPQ